ncbi:hypothetical protein [Tabrizicola sp.]|uniref:hypothetical protein n=1 Tax=Tabrizicola sp. TaxID=2005166 RepID=UPI00286C514A|nr:hypothetical protein [Tabrizicola sp.]
MITDRRLWLIAPPLVLAGWIAVLAGVMRLGGDAPAALVMLPPPGFASALPAGVAILSAGPYSLTVKADAPGLVAALYALGAPLVLPAGLTGCLPQTAG